MKDFAGLGHLFVAAFLFHFSSYMVLPSITDVTMEAVCPGRDECSVAIYLSGFQNAVSLSWSAHDRGGTIDLLSFLFLHWHAHCRSLGWGLSW